MQFVRLNVLFYGNWQIHKELNVLLTLSNCNAILPVRVVFSFIYDERAGSTVLRTRTGSVALRNHSNYL